MAWLMPFLLLLSLALSAACIYLLYRVRRLERIRYRFNSVLQHSPNPVFVKDIAGRYLHVSHSFAKLLNKKENELIGKEALDCLPENQGFEELQKLDDIIFRTGQPCHIETKLNHGVDQRFIIATKFPLYSADGILNAIGCIATDVTAQRENELRLNEAEEQYRALAEQKLVGVFIQQHGVIVYINQRLADLMDYSIDELLGQSLDECLIDSEIERIRQQTAYRIENQVEHHRFTTTLRCRGNRPLPVEIHSRLFDYHGQSAFIGVVLDISERLATETKLKLASTVFENSSEGILLTDHEARIIAVNAAFSRITGYSEAEAVGRRSRMFRVDHMGHAVNAQMMRALDECGLWQGEFLDRRKDGDLYPVWLSISAVSDDTGAVQHYVCVFSDITKRKVAEDRLQFLASHDPLTRLPNRVNFIERLTKAVDHARENNSQLAVMFIDLDRFKLINDSFGHPAGDDLLRVISARLKYAVGNEAFLGRFDGDEFTVIFEGDCHKDAITAIADRLLTELAQPLKLEEHELFVTGSIGIAIFPSDGNDAMSLLKNADTAMYRAKEAGKNTYEFFAATMNEQAFERLLMENGLRLALERQEFRLVYQPQVNPFTDKVQAVEALLRWYNPEIGMVSPAQFIPIAEESGLIRPIGEWVMAEACRQLARWDAEGVEVPRVAVNLSPRQFMDSRLLDKVVTAFTAAGISPQRLELEVTESTLMQDPAEAIQVLNQLKSLGVMLAIDDFGTGYSSLSNLKRFPLDCLKIDRSFIEGIPDDGDNVAITEAIMAMAKKLRLFVVAEGVETSEQRLFLKRCGCELIQGYFYSKPLPPEQLADFVSEREQNVVLNID